MSLTRSVEPFLNACMNFMVLVREEVMVAFNPDGESVKHSEKKIVAFDSVRVRAVRPAIVSNQDHPPSLSIFTFCNAHHDIEDNSRLPIHKSQMVWNTRSEIGILESSVAFYVASSNCIHFY